MATNVIVVIENEDARIRLPRAIEMRGREPADATADDDEIIVFAGRRNRAGA